MKRQRRRIVLKDAFKQYHKGQYKLIPPATTIKNGLSALKNLDPPIKIFFSRTDRLDKIDIPSYTVRMNRDAEYFYAPLKKSLETFGMSWGKGADTIQSKASAIMEFIERFSLAWFLCDNRKLIRSSSLNLTKKHLRANLPHPFNSDPYLLNEMPSSPSLWSKSFSLTKDKNILFPFDSFLKGTNGCASGNSLEEAILQGLCEVIERHVTTLIFEKDLLAPTIDINSIHDNLAAKLIDKFTSKGIKLYIKDFSLGLPIPSIAIMAHDPRNRIDALRFFCAAGTALDRNAALVRALLEIAQHRSQSLYRKKMLNSTYGITALFPNYGHIRETGCFTERTDVVSLDSLPNICDPNFRVEIDTAVRALGMHGHEVIVTDMTHRSIGIPVALVSLPLSNCSMCENDPYLHLIRQFKYAGNYRKCIDAFSHYFRFNPDLSGRADLLYLLGSVYEDASLNKKALKCYNDAYDNCTLNNTILFTKLEDACMRIKCRRKR
jgi:ribosomal protein S12 methylthiotransferase accessory factor